MAPRVKGGKEHIKDVRRAHARICRRVGQARELPAGSLDLTIHDYRRTLASWLVAQGAPDPVIADVLGHKNLSSVKGYARLRKGGATTMQCAAAAVGAMQNRRAEALAGSHAEDGLQKEPPLGQLESGTGRKINERN